LKNKEFIKYILILLKICTFFMYRFGNCVYLKCNVTDYKILQERNMQQKGYVADSAAAIAQYFEKAALPTQQETLGQVVVEILSDGRNLNRKSLCTKLLSRLEKADGPEEEEHYHMLLGLLFER